MRAFLFFAALLIAVATSLPFSNSARAVDLDKGEVLFSQYCITCHAGGRNAIISERNLSKDALDQYLGNSVDPFFVKQKILVGSQWGMPPFAGNISEEDIDSIAAYVLMKADQGW